MKRLSSIALALCLLACATDDESTSKPALTREELLNPESCKDCHPKHYEQWSSSMHAYATQDPVFAAMNKRGQEETGGTLGKFCVNCHAPMAVHENAITDFSNLDSVPAQLKGVTCYFCHNVNGVGPDHFNNPLQLADDNVMRGRLNNPIEPSTHKVAYSSFHDSQSADSAQMCGTCHDLKTPKGVPLERTYQEYQESFFSNPTSPRFQSCNSCHMPYLPGGRQRVAEDTGRPGTLPLARDFHEHLWPAVDVAMTDFPHADALRSAVSACFLPSAISTYILNLMPGPLGRLELLLETQAGHGFPSGAAQDRRLWVEIIGYDANNQEVYRIGQIGDQEVEEAMPNQHPCMFREYIADENGAETHDFWEAFGTPTGKLMPAGAMPGMPHTAMCQFAPPLAFAEQPAAFIDIKLRMRPMGIDVLQDLVSTGHLAPEYPPKMSTFTVASRRATYDPVKRSYGISPVDDDPTLGDCHTYYCLLDPQSQECVKTQ